jgi:hypothetical protein
VSRALVSLADASATSQRKQLLVERQLHLAGRARQRRASRA